MHIAASTLYDFVQCPTRVALDAFGDATKRDPINPFVRLLWERGTLFERETIAKLDQPFTDLSEFKEDENERLTPGGYATWRCADLRWSHFRR